MSTVVYHAGNICIGSELSDFSEALFKHVSKEPTISEKIKERIEQRFQATTEMKIQSLHDEIDLRRDLGQLVHP